MRRNWQAIPLVVVVGALAGAAIAGRPTTPENDVRISPSAVTTSTSSTLSASTTTVEPATTDASPETDAPDTTEEAPDTSDDDEASATTDESSATTDDESTDTTDQPTTTQRPTTTTSTSSATTASGGAAPESARPTIRVLVANGTNAARLAGGAADKLRALGYTAIVTDDANRGFGLSAVYANDANRAAALRVAEDLGIPLAFVLSSSGEPVTDDDSRGDVVVALGEEQI